MDTPCDQSPPPAGRLDGGGVRFYAWTLDPDNGRHRISVHERDPARGHATDEPLDLWLDTYDEAEAWVTTRNMEACR